MPEIDTRYEACVAACEEAIEACRECIAGMAGLESSNDCPACCSECLRVIGLTLEMMGSNGKFLAQYWRLCAEVCDWCAEQCGAHEHDHCRRCAETCQVCAAECRKLSESGGA